MSRVAKSPIQIPGGVDVSVSEQEISVKGAKGKMSLSLASAVAVEQEDNQLSVVVKENSKQARAMSGTTRALINNMVVGVSQGFERKLELVGVGYRAKASGRTLNLTLGFSHPIDYALPEGIDAATPSQTEVVLTGADKQLLGQVAADIRAFRPPEPYKGKGVRYAGEHIRRKDAKKK